MATIDQGSGSEDEAARSARIAAMARAAQAGGGGFQSALNTQGEATPAAGFGLTKSGFGATAGAGAGGGGGGGTSAIATPEGALAQAPTPPTAFGAPNTGAPGGLAGGPAYNMDTLRAQAAEAAAAANAANAARNAGSGGSVAPAVSTPATAAVASGGSLAPVSKPITTPPTTTTTTTDEPNAANKAYTLATASSSTGAGAGPVTTGPGSTTGPGTGPTGAGGGTIDTGPGAGAGGNLGALTSNIVGQIQSISQSLASPGTSTDVTGVFMQQTQGILAMLDQQEAQLRAESQKNGTSIDPATQFTIDKLKQTLGEQLKTVKEDLNRRGLSDSGIQLELENRLQKGSMSDQAQILATRLSKLQDDLSQGLANIRSQKYSTVNQFGLAGANAQFTSGENAKKDALQREQDALTGMLNLRNQQSGEQQASLDRSFKSNESALQRAYGEAQSKAQTSADFAANEQKYNQQLALQNNSQQFTGGQNALSRAAAAANAGKVNVNTVKPNGETDVSGTVNAAIQGINSDYSNAADAVSALAQRQDQIVASIGQAGYDRLVKYANEALPDWQSQYGGKH